MSQSPSTAPSPTQVRPTPTPPPSTGGDGSPPENLPTTGEGGSGSLSGTRVYGDNGSYTLIVTIQDDDGGSVTATRSLLVSNIAPSDVRVNSTGVVPMAGGEAFLSRQGSEDRYGAEATDSGSDDLSFNWSFGVTNTHYNNGDSPDPASSPDGIFPFAATDTVATIWTAPGLHTLSVTVSDDDGGAATDSRWQVVTGAGQCTREPGFWRQQFSERGRRQYDPATLAAYLGIIRFASAVFPERAPLGSLADAQAILGASAANKWDRAAGHLLAAWLNFADGAVGWQDTVDSDGDGLPDLAFHQVISQVEAILLAADPTNAQLEHAKNLAAAVNTFTANAPGCGG